MVFTAKEQTHVLDRWEEISKETRIVLVGDHGVGKTWIAREISDSLVKKNLISVSLWLSLNGKYTTIDQLDEDIAQQLSHQLSVFSTAEREYQDDGANNKGKKQEPEAKMVDMLRKKIRDKLKKIIPMKGEENILLILDGVPDKMKYEEQKRIISNVTELLHLGKQHSLKLLVTKTVSKMEYIVNYLKGDQRDANYRIELVDDCNGDSKTGIVSEMHEFLEQNSSVGKGKTEVVLKPLQVRLTQKKDVRQVIYEEMVRQLCDQGRGDDIVNEGGQKESFENLEKKIWEKLLEMAAAKDVKKYAALLILEDVPNDMIDEVVLTVETLMPLKEQLLKVLVTRRNASISSALIPLRKEEVIEIEPLSKEKFEEVLQLEAINNSLSDINKMPAALLFMIREAMKGIEEDNSRNSVLENVLLDAANIEEANKIKSLARCGYDMLPHDNEAMIKCFWHSTKLFAERERLHYNELITYWIMEGYFDPVDRIEKAYEKGHRVLMELQRRCILKIQGHEFVSMERLAMDVPDHRRDGDSGSACLGLTLLEKGGLKLDLGIATLADGMIKSLSNPNEWEKITTLVIDGTRLHREVPMNFFKPMKELEILVLLKPRFKSLDFLESLVLQEQGSPSSKLRILVIRGCDILEKIDHIKKLDLLEVLEISGARNLKEIPDDAFAKLTKLQSLNLSALPITSLSPSFSKLTELRWLILRHCSCLEKLSSLKIFQKLEVLDLYGASTFKGFEDGELNSLLKLKMLDLSKTQIKKLPVLNDSQALTQLLLKDCKSLINLPKLSGSPSLRILDVSGTTSLKEVRTDSLRAKTELRILDLSGSKISRLPSNLSGLLNLEVLDLSNLTCFDETEKRKPGKQESENEIDKINFGQLKSLRQLNLSNTKVKKLPSLSGLGNFRELLLTNCESLEELPEMQGLNRLEILDLAGACLLVSIPDMNSGNFGCLRHLNLSKTKVQKLPSLSNLGSLCQLLLSGCQTLKELPNTEGLTRLEKLDLSDAISLERIPDGAFNQMSSLRQLLLVNCKKLSKLPALGASKKLEVIDLFGCSALTEIEGESFQNIASLEQFKLSESEIQHLPSLPNLGKLSHLVLRNCSKLEEIPSLKSLSNLKELDICGALSFKETEAKLLENMTNLRQLWLRDCSSLNCNLPCLEKLIHLETLDLQGIIVKKFPYWISKLINLKSLHLPDLKQIEELDWGKIKRLPHVPNWDECGIFTNPEIHSSKRDPFISVSGTENIRSLIKESQIWDKCFKNKFHFSVCSSTCWKDEHIYGLSDEIQDIHFNTLSCPEKNGGSLEIRGFDNGLPSDVEEILKQSIYVFLTENQFVKHLSDIGEGNMASVKGIWLESCGNMETIFSEKEDIKFNQSLEILWVSNLVKLQSFCRGTVQVGIFKSLKHLYLNCCPKLENVFTPQQLPENLEILEIKFCDRLKTLCEPGSEECALKKLRELNLVELPVLSGIRIRLPSLKNVKVRNCPFLENDMQHRMLECFRLLESAHVEVYRNPDEDNLGMCLMKPQKELQNNPNSTPR